MIRKSILWVVFGIALAVACADDASFNDYYMPPISKGERIVIVYESINILKQKQFWLVEKTADAYLILVYDSKGNLIQESEERVTSEGIVQNKVKIQWRDSSGQNNIYVEPDILHKGLFPFYPKDSLHAYVHCMHWEVSNTDYELCRNRRFLGKQELDLEGEFIDCAIFKTSEMFGDAFEGYLEIKTDGLEVYAKGRGMVLRRKFVTGLMDVGQRQINILDLEAFRQTYP